MKKNFCTYLVLAMTVLSVVGTTLHYHHSSVASESLSINQVTEIEFCCPFAHNQEINTPNYFSDDYVIQPCAFLSILAEKPHLDSDLNCRICDRAPPFYLV